MLVSPEYCTGRQLWRLGMPATLNPSDPAWVPGQVSAIVHTGSASTATVRVWSGGPTDTYAITLDIVASGALGAAAFRYRLQDTDAWSLPILIPADAEARGYAVWLLPESGLILAFAVGAAGLTAFQAGDTYAFSTVESPQQADLRRAVSDEIERMIKPRGGQPARDWDVGLAELAAQKVAYRLGRIRGFDPRTPHDQLILRGEKHANAELRRIMEEIEQMDTPGQDAIPGVACSSQPPQGAEPW